MESKLIKKTNRSSNVTREEHGWMVDYLILNNDMLKILNGSSTDGLNSVTVTAGKQLKKITAYQGMSEYVIMRSLGRVHWVSEKTKGKWESYLGKYNKTKRNYEDSSGGKYTLTEDDLKKGINTIDEKLDRECHHYKRIDELFGEKQNVKPTDIKQSVPPSPMSYVSNSIASSESLDDVSEYTDVSEWIETNDSSTILSEIDIEKEKKRGKKKRVFSDTYAAIKSDEIAVMKDALAIDSKYKDSLLSLQREELNMKIMDSEQNRMLQRDELNMKIMESEQNRMIQRDELNMKTKDSDKNRLQQLVLALASNGMSPVDIKSYMELLNYSN